MYCSNVGLIMILPVPTWRLEPEFMSFFDVASHYIRRNNKVLKI